MAEVVKNNLSRLLNKRSKKKLIMIALAIVLVGGAGIYLYQTLTAKSSTTSTMRLVTVKRGDVTESITSSGTVQASKRVTLTPSAEDAIITAIHVKVGDKVKAGQLLATLDQTATQIQLKSAEANVLSAKAKLEEAQKPKTAAEMKALEATVIQAKANLEAVKNGYDTKKAQNDLEKAKTNLNDAQNTYNTQKNLYAAGIISKDELDQAKQSLDQAKIEYNNSELQNNQTKGQALSSLEQAESAYETAVADLNEAKDGPDAATVQSAKAALAQAEAQLLEQQRTLTSLTVIAPMDGTIVEVNGNVGEKLSDTLIVMDNSSSGKLEVSAQISESDIGKVKEGLTATFTTNSYTDKEFTGKVTLVYPEATTDSGVTSYKVLLSVDNPEGLLKTGMSVDVTIKVGTHQNVLYVPAAALKTQNGKDGVNVVSDQSDNQSGQGNRGYTFKPVTIGYFGSNMVEITSGLQEGDQVVLTLSNSSSSSNSNNRQNQMGGIPGVGGMGGPPGGFISGGNSRRN